MPLIPEFKEYLLQELQAQKILNRLAVDSVSEQFEAWELFCTGEDKNIIRVVEDGLKNGAISIPNATQENSAVFETVNTVSEYLKEFGTTIAEQIKSRFNPIFDPSTEQLSKEILSVNDNIYKNTGYSLYEAQLAVSEAVKRKIDKHEPALIVAECGSGKTKQGAAALYASHLAAGKTKTFNVVLCPSHMTEKWVRELEETVPNVVADVIKSINTLKDFYHAYERDNKTFFAVISKEKARDGYMHRPVPSWNERKQAFRCPSCNEFIEQELSDDGIKYRVRASADYFKKENRKNHKCENCGEILWQPLFAHEQSEWVKISDYGFTNRKTPLAFCSFATKMIVAIWSVTKLEQEQKGNIKMNLNEKMLAVISDVNHEVIEREELNNYIAIAILTNKNLFILGGTGQAKSYAIDQFRRRITGAKQFKRTLSKQTDEEALFGRLDLGSLIPGNVATEVLEHDDTYKMLKTKLDNLKSDYEKDYDDGFRQAMSLVTEQISDYKKTLSELQGNDPRIITTGKIPDSHICFMDEIFKANDGVLNSLLEALNEHTYTNEGHTIVMPTISFFAASNEIPQFSDPAEKILLPLYDRFELKIITDYVKDRTARLLMLKQKQGQQKTGQNASISLDELYKMQCEVGLVVIPDSVNALMDDILCELRRQGLHISDRKYFGYSAIVQAKAWLEGRNEVVGSDLMALSCYLWTAPEELPIIVQTLQRMCENPLAEKINSIHAMAAESYEAFENEQNPDNSKALIKLRTEFIALYKMVETLQFEAKSDGEQDQLSALLLDVEAMSLKAHNATNFTYLTLSELSKLN